MENKNAKLYYSVAIVSFIISGYFSILLFKSTATTFWEAIPMVAIAVILEIAKFSLLRESLSGKHSAWLKVSVFLLWVVITISSIVASAGYVVNQTNKATNISIKSSDQYQDTIRAKDNQSDLYSTKKTEIEKLYSDKDKAVSDLGNQRDKMSNKYISKKVELSQKMNEIEESYNKRISSLSSELSGISKSINKPLDLSSAQIRSTSGYTALFGLSADLYNKNAQEKVSAESLEMWFFLLLGIVLELVANIFAYLSFVNGYSFLDEIRPKNTEHIATPHTQPEEIRPNYEKKETAVAGFRPEKCIDSTMKEKFYSALMESAKSKGTNKADGYDKIASKLGIRREDARTIRKELEREGRITKQGNRTVIV